MHNSFGCDRAGIPEAMPPQTRRSVTFEDNRIPQDAGSRPGPSGDQALGAPEPVAPGSFRARMHANPGTKLAWRAGVFVAGLICVAVGLALTVLPGPLTIPPVVLGLWIWSTEFAWARSLFQSAKRKAKATWAHAKQHPVSSAAITVGGLVAAAAVIWAVGHFGLVDKAVAALGF